MLIFIFCKHRTAMVILKSFKDMSQIPSVLLFLFLIKMPQCEVQIS